MKRPEKRQTDFLAEEIHKGERGSMGGHQIKITSHENEIRADGSKRCRRLLISSNSLFAFSDFSVND